MTIYRIYMVDGEILNIPNGVPLEELAEGWMTVYIPMSGVSGKGTKKAYLNSAHIVRIEVIEGSKEPSETKDTRRIYHGIIVEDCFDCPLHSYDTCKHPASPSEFGRRERMTWICDDEGKAVFPNDCPLKEVDNEEE